MWVVCVVCWHYCLMCDVCVSDSVVGGINESFGCVFAESGYMVERGADVCASTDTYCFFK